MGIFGYLVALLGFGALIYWGGGYLKSVLGKAADSVSDAASKAYEAIKPNIKPAAEVATAAGGAAILAKAAAVGAGTVGLAGGAVFLPGDTPKRDESREGKIKQLQEYREAKARIAAGGVSGWMEEHFGASRLDERIAELESELDEGSKMSIDPRAFDDIMSVDNGDNMSRLR